MNINDLTIGQAKEVAELFLASSKSSGIYSSYVGTYVICRSRNEGVNFGKVIALDETGVVLDDARRLYYHKPKNKNVSWYEGIAKSGISADSKLSTSVKKLIVEDYSLTACSEESIKSLVGAADNEQS